MKVNLNTRNMEYLGPVEFRWILKTTHFEKIVVELPQVRGKQWNMFQTTT